MSDRELYRTETCIVQTAADGRVVIQTGRQYEGWCDALVDARELRDALDEYLEADDE